MTYGSESKCDTHETTAPQGNVPMYNIDNDRARGAKVY